MTYLECFKRIWIQWADSIVDFHSVKCHWEHFSQHYWFDKVFNGSSLRGTVWTSKRRKSHTSPSWFQPKSSPTFFLFTFHYCSSSVPPFFPLLSVNSSHSSFSYCTLLSSFPIPPLLSEIRTVSRAIYLAECTMDSTHSHISKMRYVLTNGALGMGVMEDGVDWALLSPSDRIYKIRDQDFPLS